MILQFIVFGFFLAGIIDLKLNSKLKRHRILMGVAVVLNALSIVLVMARPFAALLGIAVESRLLGSVIYLVLVHGSIGAVAEIMGAVFLWKHPRNLQTMMKIAAILWTLAFVLGAAYYRVYVM